MEIPWWCESRTRSASTAKNPLAGFFFCAVEGTRSGVVSYIVASLLATIRSRPWLKTQSPRLCFSAFLVPATSD